MFFWNTIKKLKEENEQLKKDNTHLLNELTSKNKIVFGVIDKPTNEEMEQIGENVNTIKLIVKYLTYKFVINSDHLRNLSDKKSYEEKVGYLNCLNELCLFFYNYTIPKKQEEEYSGQNLK